MARPTRYCQRCGEFVAEQFVTRGRSGNLTTVEKLVHIDGAGVRIYRNHEPVEE